MREFSGAFGYAQWRHELRLMPQPLYRYDADDEGGTFDGALFAFAQGTDPEILLPSLAFSETSKAVTAVPVSTANMCWRPSNVTGTRTGRPPRPTENSSKRSAARRDSGGKGKMT